MSNATGQQLTDWQKKIIGRKDRWTVVFNVVDGAMQQGGAGAIGAIRDDAPALAKEAVRNATAFQRPVQVMGKSFAPGIRINWIRRGIKWAAGGLTSAATGFGTGLAEKSLREAHPADRVYRMSTADVRFNLNKSGVYLNEDLIAELESKTGYKFDSKRFADKVDAAIAQAGDGFYDNVWRTELMPHIVKSLFREELENMHNEIARQAEEKGITSEELLDDTLATGTDLMKQIVEDYTTDLADKTELLGSPIRFTKESPDPTAQSPEGMTADEKKRWENHVSDMKKVNFLTTESELRTMRANAMKAYPLKSTADVVDSFNKRMSAQAPAGGQPDINSGEATAALLEIREIKNRYKKRGWFNRNIFHRSAANAERRAITEMTARLKEKYPPAEVDRALNDPNYMAGKGGSVNAKQVYKLADVSPRSLTMQRIGDQAYAYGVKGAEIVGNIGTAVKNIAVYGYQVGGGFLGGAVNGAKNVINKWWGGGEQPPQQGREENKKDAEQDRKEPVREDLNKDAQEKEADKENVRKDDKDIEKEAGKEDVKKDDVEKKADGGYDNMFDFDNDDFMGGFGVEEEVIGEEQPPKDEHAGEKEEKADGKEAGVDMDEDDDVFEDAVEDPRDLLQQEKNEEIPQDVDMAQADPLQQKQGWGEWLWGGVKSAAGYAGGLFSGGQQEAPKVDPPKQDAPEEEQEEEWHEMEEDQEEQEAQEERKEDPKENRKDGDVRDMDFAQFQDKIGGPAGKPKEDFAKKRQEILDAKPGLKLGNVNGQPAQSGQVVDNNKAMLPGGNQ